ncbi:hypothetical protein [Actinophytocola sp.]|uniref:tetratricopeptide repeat protein n=1 Tax=Actinophytocola sp. TaxID=1872138 RepID=UPI002ED420DA
MDEELAAVAAGYFADACERSGHSLSPTPSSRCRCRTLADRLENEWHARLEAETFDIPMIHARFAPGADVLPSAEWHPAALFRDFSNEILSPPWLGTNTRKREVRLTLSLARLGELGIPPDAMVRVGFERRLRSAIKHHVMSAISTGDLQPVALRPWLNLVAETVDAPAVDTDDGAKHFAMFHAFEGGALAERIRSWTSTAPIECLLSWSYTEEKDADLREEDVNIRGGHEAIHWLVDRFTHTDYDDWYRASLYWELRFAANPEATASEAGLPLSLLNQRPLHTGLLIESIVSRASYALDHELLIGNVSGEELSSYVVTLLRNGAVDQAVVVLRSVLDKAPGLWSERSMLGFCLIPKDPEGALEQINRCAQEVGGGTALLLANRASAFMRLKQTDRAQNVLRNVRKLGDTQTYILWNPADLVHEGDHASVRIDWYPLREWVEEATSHMVGHAGPTRSRPS